MELLIAPRSCGLIPRVICSLKVSVSTPHVHYEKLLLRLKPWEHQASADVDCPTIQGGTYGLALATGPAEGP